MKREKNFFPVEIKSLHVVSDLLERKIFLGFLIGVRKLKSSTVTREVLCLISANKRLIAIQIESC